MATTIFQFEIFSDEIILKVFGYLDIDDLFKCSLTSRRLRAISQDKSLPSIWENIHLYNPIPICKKLKNSCTKITGCVHINLKKISDQSLKDILKKGCNYLVLSHMAGCSGWAKFHEVRKYIEPFKLKLLDWPEDCALSNRGLKIFHTSFNVRDHPFKTSSNFQDF